MPYALDANGNLTFDTYHSYAWDAENGVWSIDSNYLTHDAFERVVEICVRRSGDDGLAPV